MTSGRVRALTRKPRRLEVAAKFGIPVVKREMELHLEAAKDYLSIPHHKVDSQYTPTYRYQQSWDAGGGPGGPARVREVSTGLVGTLKNEVVDLKRHGRPYAKYVAGTETEESDQAGEWLGPWNQLVVALRDAGGGLTFREKILRAIKRVLD